MRCQHIDPLKWAALQLREMKGTLVYRRLSRPLTGRRSHPAAAVREDGELDLTLWWDCLAATKRPSYGRTGLVSWCLWLWFERTCVSRARMQWA